MLDLARDVPRSDTDVQNAVAVWISLGTEMAKPHFQALLTAVSKILPALTNGIYRSHLLSAFAAFPWDILNAVTEPGVYFPAAQGRSKRTRHFTARPRSSLRPRSTVSGSAPAPRSLPQLPLQPPPRHWSRC